MSTKVKLTKKIADGFHKTRTLIQEQFTTGLHSVRDWQKQGYGQIRELVAKKSPNVLQQYDSSPGWMKTGLFFLPWVLVVLLTLYYFDAFDSRPRPAYIQDPSVVYVNDDLSKMVKNGQVRLAPFIEELRVSGRIDFNGFGQLVAYPTHNLQLRQEEALSEYQML
jgi:hypothetical protein